MKNSTLVVQHLCLLLFASVLLHDAITSTADVSQQLIGCYKDNDSNPAMGPNVSNNQSMTNDMCSQICRQSTDRQSLSTTFFGTENGTLCFCAEQYNKYDVANNCNVKCGGNQSQKCGGEDALSVHWVCPIGSYGANCANRTCHCKNNTSGVPPGVGCYRNGTCPGDCAPGWQGPTCNLDIDECKTITHGCEQNCSNTEGSYYCSCRSGFTLANNNKDCTDINECASNKTHNCSQLCHNTLGSFNCSCQTGFELNNDGTNCTDIDECAWNGTHRCEQLCNNTVGSYSCWCSSGFRLDINKLNCTDIDECNHTRYDCHQICNNTEGSYNCSCFTGYSLNSDGRNCTDIDECLQLTHDCQHNCTNTIGSFNCSCLSGYALDDNNRNCSDIDECNTTVNATSSSAIDNCEQICDNTEGSYACLCDDGYNLQENGWECIVVADSGEDLILLVLLPIILLIIATIIAAVIYIRRRRTLKKATKNEEPASYERPVKLEESPYSELDPGSMCRPVTIKVLQELVRRIRDDSNYLAAEFQSIPIKTDAKCDFALKPEVKKKNRFKNILPYDDNRVQLSELDNEPQSTYINASFIKGYTENDKFIASHGPMSSTIDDFWRMIWEYNVGVVVMVTRCIEEGKAKCEQYWPESCPMDFCDVKTEPVDAEQRPDRTVRKFKVSKNGEPTRTVTQLQLTDWPDHGVPEHAVSLLAIRHAVKRIVGPEQYIVVHCSAGVGRTGTYLAVDYLLSQGTEDNFVDVFSCVSELRKQRMNSVQTLDQYAFIFKAVLEGLTLGQTTQSIDSLQDHVCRLHSTNRITGKSRIETEFQMLQEMLPLPHETVCTDALTSVTRSKNRDRRLIPMNSRRVYLKSSTRNTSDYINAVFVPSFQRTNCYISTQLPLSSTVGDFWNMCVDYNSRVVLYLSHLQYAEDLFSFLPKRGDSLQFGMTCVGELNELAARDSETCQMFSVVASRLGDATQASPASRVENVYANIQQLDGLHSVETPGRITIVQAIIPETEDTKRQTLMQTQCTVVQLSSTEFVNDSVRPPIVVMSRDGVVHCGQFIAVCNLCDMINTQKEVDVFQTVYNIKRAQPHFFTHMVDYEELYTTASYFVQPIRAEQFN